MLMVFVLSLMTVAPALGDVTDSGHVPAYTTDYYVIIEAPEGGIDLYSTPEETETRLNTEPIPNGSVLHVEGEKTNASGVLYGYVSYHGMRGYIRMEYANMVSQKEALQAQTSQETKTLVNYDAQANGKAGSVAMYHGPSEQFGLVEGSTAIPNGDVLHVSAEVENSEGSKWVQAVHDGAEGWVLQSQIVTPTPTPTSTPTPTPTPTPLPTSTPTPTPAPTSTSTPTPAPTSTNTPTPAPTNTPTAVPTSTSTPIPTNTPIEAVEISETAKPVMVEEDSSGSDFLATEAPEEPAAEETVSRSASSLPVSPILIVVGIAMVCVLIILLVALKKKNDQ